MRWRVLAAGALAVSCLTATSAAAAPHHGMTCGRPTPIDRSAPIGRAVPLGHLLWIGVYPFDPGYPTKAVVVAKTRFVRRVAIHGWDCSSGDVLRVWYREGLPFPQVLVSAAELRRAGDRYASFGPWPAGAMRGGYLLFWRTGRWKIVATAGRREVASAIVRAARE